MVYFVIRELNMLLLSFQISLLILILFSFLLVVAVPVVFASPNAWDENKNVILLGSVSWGVLVLVVVVA